MGERGGVGGRTGSEAGDEESIGGEGEGGTNDGGGNEGDARAEKVVGAWGREGGGEKE